MNSSQAGPPRGAPEGTQWFGGPVDRCKATLRIFGEGMNPDEVTAVLGVNPTHTRNPRFPIQHHIDNFGNWSLTLSSEDEGMPSEVEQVIDNLIRRLPNDPDVWRQLTQRFKVDVFVGLFLYADNRGFELSPVACKWVSDLGIKIGFDIYFDPRKSAYAEAGRQPPPGTL